MRENQVFKLYKISPALWKLRFFEVPKLLKFFFLFLFFGVKFVVLGCFSAWFKGKNSQKVRKKIVKISEKNPLLNKHFLRLPL